MMERDHFDRTLSALRRQAPFQPFAVRFVSGESIQVDHPEALVVRAGVAVYLGPDGAPTLFDHESVSEVSGKSRRRG
jgi:hypothetical protein